MWLVRGGTDPLSKTTRQSLCLVALRSGEATAVLPDPLGFRYFLALSKRPLLKDDQTSVPKPLIATQSTFVATEPVRCCDTVDMLLRFNNTFFKATADAGAAIEYKATCSRMCEYPLLRRLVATEPVVYTILTRFEIMLIRSAI